MNYPHIDLYADGSAAPNPGIGGYGAILVCGKYRKELSQGYVLSTNNRMELMGVIVALESIKKTSIVIVTTDSKYVVNGIEKGWARNWKSKNWDNNTRLNYDLWDRLLNVLDMHQVTFKWVKGHNGHIENERCDKLAVAAGKGTLLVDVGYNNLTAFVGEIP